MGKSQDAPPPPDYGPLAAANEASAKFSYKAASDQLAWAKKTYAENKKTSDAFTDFVMGQMDKQAGWADADRARYEEIFQPLEDSLAKDAAEYASPEKKEHEAGKAETDVAQQFEQARRTAQERLEAYGVDPTQTRAGAMDLQTRVAEAAAQASAGNQARERVENVGRALRSEAINIGNGYPGQIAGAAAGAQGAGQAGVNSGLATTASGSATMNAPQGWQQAGNQSVANWGNMLHQGYSDQLEAYKQENSQSSGVGGLLGLAGGIVSKMPGFEGGGVIPERGFMFAEGGDVPAPSPTNGDVRSPGGGPVPASMSPSGGAVVDDVPALIDGAHGAQLSANEFVIPEDVMRWKGEEWAQKEITKARGAMQGGNGERPAQPTMGAPQQAVLPVQ